MGEIRRIEHRHAVDFEPRILVLDPVGFLVVNDPHRLDLPERRAHPVLFAQIAGRVDGAVEGGAVAFGADGGGGRHARAVSQQHPDALDRTLAQVVGELDKVREDHIARRIDQADVA